MAIHGYIDIHKVKDRAVLACICNFVCVSNKVFKFKLKPNHVKSHAHATHIGFQNFAYKYSVP